MIKIAFFGNSSGSFYWRLADPFKYMSKTGEFEFKTGEGITRQIADWADIYVLQGCVDKNGIALLYEYQQEKGKKIVVDQDDYLRLDKDNPNIMLHKAKDATFVISRTLEIADMVTTTTPKLARKLKHLNKNIVILPNYMDMKRWKLKTQKNDSEEIRIGWLGSTTHYDDLKSIRKALIDILIEYPQVKLILMGDLRLANMFKGFNVECMIGVPFDFYPTRLHGLRIDIGIAPLRNSEFNKCKSAIKVMEYGICKVPCVASSVEPYRRHIKDGKNGLLAVGETGFLTCLEMLIEDKELRERIGQASFENVTNNYNLERNIQKWVKAYKNLVN